MESVMNKKIILALFLILAGAGRTAQCAWFGGLSKNPTLRELFKKTGKLKTEIAKANEKIDAFNEKMKQKFEELGNKDLRIKPYLNAITESVNQLRNVMGRKVEIEGEEIIEKVPLPTNGKAPEEKKYQLNEDLAGLIAMQGKKRPTNKTIGLVFAASRAKTLGYEANSLAGLLMRSYHRLVHKKFVLDELFKYEKNLYESVVIITKKMSPPEYEKYLKKRFKKLEQKAKTLSYEKLISTLVKRIDEIEGKWKQPLAEYKLIKGEGGEEYLERKEENWKKNPESITPQGYKIDMHTILGSGEVERPRSRGYEEFGEWDQPRRRTVRTSPYGADLLAKSHFYRKNRKLVHDLLMYKLLLLHLHQFASYKAGKFVVKEDVKKYVLPGRVGKLMKEHKKYVIKKRFPLKSRTALLESQQVSRFDRWFRKWEKAFRKLWKKKKDRLKIDVLRQEFSKKMKKAEDSGGAFAYDFKDVYKQTKAAFEKAFKTFQTKLNRAISKGQSKLSELTTREAEAERKEAARHEGEEREPPKIPEHLQEEAKKAAEEKKRRLEEAEKELEEKLGELEIKTPKTKEELRKEMLEKEF
jgi:hypothetical protein